MSDQPPWKPATDAICAIFNHDWDAAEEHLLAALSAVRKCRQHERRRAD